MTTDQAEPFLVTEGRVTAGNAVFIDVLHVNEDATTVTFTSDAFVGGSSSEYRGEIVGEDDKTARAYVSIDDVDPGEYDVTADLGDAGSGSFPLVVEEPSEGKVNIKLAIVDEDTGLLDLQAEPISRGGLSAEFRTKLGDAHDKWYPFEYDQEQGSGRQDLLVKDPRAGVYQVHVRVQFHGGYSEIVTGVVTIPQDLQDDDESAADDSGASEEAAASDGDTPDQEHDDGDDTESTDEIIAADAEPRDGFLAAETDGEKEGLDDTSSTKTAAAADTESRDGFLAAETEENSQQDTPTEPGTADQQETRSADSVPAKEPEVSGVEDSDEVPPTQDGATDEASVPAEGSQPSTTSAAGESDNDVARDAAGTDLSDEAPEPVQDVSTSAEDPSATDMGTPAQQESSADEPENAEQRDPAADTRTDQELNK